MTPQLLAAAFLGFACGMGMILAAVVFDRSLASALRLLLILLGFGVSVASVAWLWIESDDRRAVEEDAEWKVLKDRYGLDHSQFQGGGGPPNADETVTLVLRDRAVECRTYDDESRLFCPVKGEPGTYAELPRKDR